jgi:hypothetical protein
MWGYMFERKSCRISIIAAIIIAANGWFGTLPAQPSRSIFGTQRTDPSRPQARYDLGGSLIKHELLFAGYVLTGYDPNATHENLSSWAERNFKYGQHIINLPDKGTEASKISLTNFCQAAFTNFQHPEFTVRLGLSRQGVKPKAFVFAIENEHLSVENYYGKDILVVDLTGQIIVFDSKDRLIIASYPFLYTARRYYNPNDNLQEVMNDLYYRGWDSESTGILGTFVNVLREKVSLSFYYDGDTIAKIGVNEVVVEKIGQQVLQANRKSLGDYKQQLAQKFMAFLAKNQNLVVVPNGSPDHNGQRKINIVPGGAEMSARVFSDNSANQLNIPEPNFALRLSLQGFKEQELSKSDIDRAVAYASFLNLSVISTADGRLCFNDNFKKVSTRIIPTGAKTDTWRWLDGSLTTLIDEITCNLQNPDPKWTKEQANGKNTQKSLKYLYSNYLSKCKSPSPRK